MDDCQLDCEVIDSYLPDWHLPSDAGIVITHMHYRWEEISALRKIHESSRVPILILSDGILEYRNIWEHPELADGAIFQPLIGHKLACIGRSQVRIVESWGNVGSCELVGLPRLDSVDRNASPLQNDGPFRLLIATANTPAFNHEQRATVIESLTHIKNRLDKSNKVNGRDMEVTWRLTDNLENEIGVPVDGKPDRRRPLSKVIDHVDAVITTPSTLFLESIQKRRPTAILDFHNSPHYVSSAWVISAPKHFNWILRELESPPPAKMLFQESIFHDNLECKTPAKPRLLNLIDEMIECGRIARETDQPIELPPRILNDPQNGFARVESGFDLRSLYPENTVFDETDVQRLQIELNQAISRLGTVPRELNEKLGFLANALTMLDHLRVRNSTMHANIRAMREQMGMTEDPEMVQKREAERAKLKESKRKR